MPRIIALFLATTFFSQLAIACPKAHCIRIGTWNVEWLGSGNRSQPADQKTINEIVNLIANQLSIDIIAFEEINTGLDGNIHGEHFSQRPWQDLQHALKDNGYKFQDGNSGHGQHIVLAWRTPVVSMAIRELLVPDHYDLHEFCRSSNLRKPLAGWFRANQFDFWLVGLHLKANGPDTKCSSAIRQAQTQDLMNALEPLIKKDPDIILIGDFNTTGHNKSLLLKNIFQPLDDRANRSPASNTHSYHSEKSKHDNSGGLLDHIMITDATRHEWQEKSTVIYKPNNASEFSKRFSDHVPLWADFYTLDDDDQ